MDALVSAGLVCATTKGYGVVKDLDVPMPVYVQAAALMGASKIVANQGTRDPVMRAVVSGAIFAAASYALFQDNNYAMNAALGAVSSYGADIALSKFVDEEVNE